MHTRTHIVSLKLAARFHISFHAFCISDTYKRDRADININIGLLNH